MTLDHRYPEPLMEGVLLRRYKRFLADVRLADGRVLTVHCPNPGSMKTCSTPGSAVRVSDSHNPKRKLPHTLEQIKSGRAWVLVNTMLPNTLTASAIQRGAVASLAGYPTLRREVSDGDRSRFDVHLSGAGKVCWVEVKNTTLKEGREARFPDAVTARGTKHLEALSRLVERGDRAVQVFTVGRADVDGFRPAWDIDPTYAEALSAAVASGVEVLALSVRVRPQGLSVMGVLPVTLAPP